MHDSSYRERFTGLLFTMLLKRSLFLFLLIPLCFTVRTAYSNPALLSGVITRGSAGTPVVGAIITVNGLTTRSVSGGIYNLTINQAGTFTVTCAKPGFEPFTSLPLQFVPGGTITLNIPLWENTVPPSNPFSWIDTVAQTAMIQWSAPSDDYELLYDDGLQENFTVWASTGNMNALRFTPHAYPAFVTGGAVHIGSATNYPAGSNPLVPFQVRVFDAGGPGGAPGNSIAGPFTVTPGGFGWVDFSFPDSVEIIAGSFYIAMVQGGTTPNAAGVAIDETLPQFRSFSRFVSGGGPWFPAGGNFMIRALCHGAGGPLLIDGNEALPGPYEIKRLRQGEEQNPAVWSYVATTPAGFTADTAWNYLPCGPYRWAVRAGYPANRTSPWAFSNISGKCWTAPVTVQVVPSCENADPEGVTVSLTNLSFPDTTYLAITDSIGFTTFPGVWKGTYKLSAIKFSYDTAFQLFSVNMPVSFAVTLLQVKMPPANLMVNDSSLVAHWDVPTFEKELLAENWNSGSFNTNGWSTEGGTNWSVSGLTGSPAPSAVFTSAPVVAGYQQSLMSRIIQGEGSTLLKLQYDIMLDYAGTTTINQMAVEIWDGTAWELLASYSSENGDIPWTFDEIDISDWSDDDFRIRFTATGGNSADIQNWNIDNIRVIASEPPQQQSNCILGYYFYLGNAISGYTNKNTYIIPPEQVQYGQTYQACVHAIYGSGYSDTICTSFESRYLFPARNIRGTPVEDSARVEWDKPRMAGDSGYIDPPGLIGYHVYRNDSLIAVINDADSLSVVDSELEPGLYLYSVTARYDLAAYGQPADTAESLPDGPLHITITFGRQLPFYEPWDMASFSYNEWRFTPGQGNWKIDNDEGFPSPSAAFTGDPSLSSYTSSLESAPFNGLPINCASVWLDFSLKLDDHYETGTESLTVEIWYNNQWHEKLSFSNTGSFDWQPYHIDISAVSGKGFRIRFRAAGTHSTEIFKWLVDNISVYPVCYSPYGLAGLPSANSVHLSWHPPVCHEGILLDEGFEDDSFPPADWTIQSANPDARWEHFSSVGPYGVHGGNYAAGLNWDYIHQDEWFIVRNVYVNGDLEFWSYAFQGSTHLDHYYVKASRDQGLTWEVLIDLSALPSYPSSNGINAWEVPYTIDLSSYDGETVDIAWHAIDGDGNGLWYPWVIDDCRIIPDDSPEMDYRPGRKSISNLTGNETRTLLGYDIYRASGGSSDFVKINQDPVPDTTYTDSDLEYGIYHYYITGRYAECEWSAGSDTITVGVITGMEDAVKSSLSVYPNPTNGVINIKTDTRPEEISVYSTAGLKVKSLKPTEGHEIKLDIGESGSGLYLLHVRWKQGVITRKISLLKE